MKSIALFTAALLSAGIASAQEVSPGKAQFAAALGVDAARYSLAELISIEGARRDNEPQTEAFFLSHQNRDVRGGVGEVSHGKAQLAASLGVNAADHSLSELVALDATRHGNDN